MSSLFANATAVEALDVDQQVGGRFDATVHDGWDIGGNANGGYLMAIAGRAMAETVGRPPITLTGHYLRPAPAGPCEIETTVVRSGRRLATVSATLSMNSKPTLTLLGTFGDQQPGGPHREMSGPVDLPSFEDCASEGEAEGAAVPEMMNRVDIRFRPGDGGFRVGEPTGAAEVQGWFALADGELIDAVGLLLASDAFPPPIFNSGLPIGWAPTVELTVHIRGVPSPGPLRCAFRSRFIHDGLLDEEGEIWDSTGALVAQSRQLALLPR